MNKCNYEYTKCYRNLEGSAESMTAIVRDTTPGMIHTKIGMQSEEEITKPQLVKEDAADILEKYYGFEGGTVTQMDGYDDLNYHCIGWKINENPHIKILSPHGYILKVINTIDSRNKQLQEAQTNLLLFLRNHNITCSVPIRNKFGHYFSTEKLPIRNENTGNQREHIIKLLEFQPGKLLKHVANNYTLYYQLGEIAAKLNIASKNFYHSAYKTHESVWHLTMLPKVKAYTYVLEKNTLKEVIEGILEEFITQTMPKMESYEKQIIHGDLNSQNVICQEKNCEWKISAIIDFGDSHMSYPLYEVAIAMFYTMLDCKVKKLDHFFGSGYTLAGYVRTNATLNIDYLLLKQCISTRLCQSYILGLHNSRIQPGNNYISENLEFYSDLLIEIARTPISHLQEIWGNVINSCTS